VRSGWAAALPFIERAETLLRGAPDAKRAAEVAGLKLAAARWRKDDQTAREAAATLRRLHSDAGLYAAGAWLFLYGADSDRPLGFVPSDGDQSTRLLTAVTRRSVDEVVQAGLLGLLPEALGQEPGRRIVALPDLLIIEDHGDVRTYPGLAPRCRQVLEAIARGEGARGQLLQAVWGIGHYRPERHDSVIKTTVSRLRSALGDRSAWLVSRNGRYELVPGVEAQLLGPSSLPPRISAGEGVPDPARLSEDGGKQAQRRKRVLHALSTGRASSAGPLARVLGLPLRTVSRELSALHERGLVTRTGSGPATRYHVVPPKGTPKGT
jgi:DNA-binding transcriptional ArsR family regulator